LDSLYDNRTRYVQFPSIKFDIYLKKIKDNYEMERFCVLFRKYFFLWRAPFLPNVDAFTGIVCLGPVYFYGKDPQAIALESIDRFWNSIFAGEIPQGKLTF